MRRFLIIILLAVVLVGCSSPQATPSPEIPSTVTPTPGDTGPQPAAATVTEPGIDPTSPLESSPSSTPAPQPTEEEASAEALSEEGPWLFFLGSYIDDRGGPFLFAVNQDSSGLTQLFDEPVVSFDVHPTDVPASGIRIACVISPDGTWNNLTLKIYTFPQGTVETITPLTTPETEISNRDQNADQEAFWNVSQIAVGIMRPDSLRWSPDGNWLAFVAALDGPSGDVYSYSPQTGEIRSLTSGPSHAWQLLWSPDSQMIAHTGNPWFEGAGTVWGNADGAWAVSPDGSTLIDLSGESGARFIGWLAPDTLLLDDGTGLPSNGNLRTVNIYSGAVTIIWEGYFNSVDFSLEDQMGLISFRGDEAINAQDADIPQADTPGIFLIKKGVLDLVAETMLMRINWFVDANVFLGLSPDGQLYSVTTGGKSTPLDSPIADLPYIAPGGDTWAWGSTGAVSGLWISQGGGAAEKVSEDAVNEIVWSPDGQSLFIIDKVGQIHVVRAPEFEAQFVSRDVLRYGYGGWLPTWIGED